MTKLVVGQIVKPNPTFYTEEEEINIRGIITSEKNEWGAHIIYWSDGGKGNITLRNSVDYVLPA